MTTPKDALTDELVTAIEEERASNQKIMHRWGVRNDLLSLFILAAMLATIGLAAELNSIIPLFCWVLAVSLYILAKM